MRARQPDMPCPCCHPVRYDASEHSHCLAETLRARSRIRRPFQSFPPVVASWSDEVRQPLVVVG
eukprot:761212-Hanusia_phi.AAC.1